jgi:hypothetical protein
LSPIHLRSFPSAKIDSFHRLQQLYGSLSISAEVYAEVVVSGARLILAKELRS